MSEPSSNDARALFEGGPVVIFRWRNEPGWPVEYVSPNVVTVFGYSDAEFVAGAIAYSALVFEGDLERVGREVAEATSSGVLWFAHEPYRVRRRDGELLWLYDYTHVLRDAEGRATHYLGYVYDVTRWVAAETEKHELELRLATAEKLESLAVLAGGVAHDFNNLLTGILGQASLARTLLADRQSPADPAELALAVDQIEQLALRAAELTQKLLAYSGSGPFVVEPVDLGAVLADMTSILDVLISKKAAVVRELCPDLPSVMADRAQMKQVVINLLTNASDALGEGEGTITLRTSVRTLDAVEAAQFELEPGTFVCLEVVDTGCGMSDEAKARLFDPFFSTKFVGRGLGMSAVIGIVRGHHGAIAVSSKVGEGSRFTILLPATDLRPPTHPPEPGPAEWKGRGVVLVADDQRAIRTTLRLLLRSLGFESVEAEDGKGAIEAFRAQRADIVLALLDMTMPGLSGVETMRELRQLEPGLPIIFSSGYSQEEVSAKVGAQSVVFLQKPYRLEELETALRTALATRR